MPAKKKRHARKGATRVFRGAPQTGTKPQARRNTRCCIYLVQLHELRQLRQHHVSLVGEFHLHRVAPAALAFAFAVILGAEGGRRCCRARTRRRCGCCESDLLPNETEHLRSAKGGGREEECEREGGASQASKTTLCLHTRSSSAARKQPNTEARNPKPTSLLRLCAGKKLREKEAEGTYERAGDRKRQRQNRKEADKKQTGKKKMILGIPETRNAVVVTDKTRQETEKKPGKEKGDLGRPEMQDAGMFERANRS